MVLVLIQSSKLFKYYPGVGCLHSTLSIWDLGPLTLSGDRGRPDGEYSWPHSPRAPSCRCCLVGASTGSGVLISPNVTVSITHPRIWPYILWSYRVDSYKLFRGSSRSCETGQNVMCRQQSSQLLSKTGN